MIRPRFNALASCALVLQAVVGLACLDAGPVPAGRHLAVDRDETQIQFFDGPVGRPRGIFLTRTQGDVHGTQRLSTIGDPGPGGGAAAPRFLMDQVVQSMFCTFDGCAMAIDALGRLYVIQHAIPPSSSPDFDPNGELVQIDPATDAQRRFGSIQGLQTSADRGRVVIEAVGAAGTLPPLVLDVDGHELTVSGQSLQFLGNDLYFLSDDSHLSRLARTALTPEALVANIGSVIAMKTERGPLLLLSHLFSPDGPSASLFDVAKLEEEPLPDPAILSQALTVSPSGRYLGAVANGGGQATHLTLFDRDTGHETTADVPPAVDSLSLPVTWRPRSDELWFIVNGDVFRWQPDGVPEKVGQDPSVVPPPLRPQTFSIAFQISGAPFFTPDGQFRLVTVSDGSDRPPVLLQSADDATAPPVLLNPKGTGVAGIWPLLDGRLLVEDWIADALRADIYLVDGVAGTTRPLATTGHVVATGRERFLAILHYVAAGGSGDLTSIDLATGAETLIAQNVYSVAVDASSDPGDPLAPGTRVAYLVRNRIASPYDGVWVMDLP